LLTIPGSFRGVGVLSDRREKMGLKEAGRPNSKTGF